jgi:large subunit ribosomal protein L4
MLEAKHYSASAEHKGSYALPQEFDGRVNKAVLYQAVRAYRNNRRQGTASTKTRTDVSGGGRKPWRQKGTGRARQGTTRSPLWSGGGVVFGPKPRSYRTGLPRKIRQSARQSALNARVSEGALYVIEMFQFAESKTRYMAQLLATLGLSDRKVLILTDANRPEIILSSRNIPNANVMRFTDASAYDILWADALIVEESAVGGHAVQRSARSSSRARRAKKASETSVKQKSSGSRKKSTRKATKRKTTKKTTKKNSKAVTKKGSKRGDNNA